MFVSVLFCALFVSIDAMVITGNVPYSPRIIGGEKSKIENFKWQAAILYKSKLHCGGSIISPTKVLTAAHCVYTIKNVGDLKVRAGSIKWDEGGSLKNVASFIQHPKYNKPTSLNNDVAVIVLSEALTFGPTIGGIALAGSSPVLAPGTMVTASGFGTTSVSSDKPDVLHHVTMPIVSPADCVKAYKKYPGKAKLTDNMICAGFYGVGGKDACKGDSGGPLVYNSNSASPILYGIISWGNQCADPNFPGVYAKVSVYRDWINNIK